MLRALRLEQVEGTPLWRITASAPVPRDQETWSRLDDLGFVIQSQEVSMIATEAQMRMLAGEMRLVFGDDPVPTAASALPWPPRPPTPRQ